MGRQRQTAAASARGAAQRRTSGRAGEPGGRGRGPAAPEGGKPGGPERPERGRRSRGRARRAGADAATQAQRSGASAGRGVRKKRAAGPGAHYHFERAAGRATADRGAPDGEAGAGPGPRPAHPPGEDASPRSGAKRPGAAAPERAQTSGRGAAAGREPRER